MKTNKNVFTLGIEWIFKMLFRVVYQLIRGIIFVPVKIGSTVLKRIRFSISFRISMVYLRLFFFSLIMGSIIVILIIGGINLSAVWEADNDSYAELIKKPNISNTEIISTAVEKGIALNIYDEQKLLVDASNNSFINESYNYWVPFTHFDGEFYFAVYRVRFYEDAKYYIITYNFINPFLNQMILFASILLLTNFFILVMTGIKSSQAGKRVLYPIQEMNDKVKDISVNNLNVRLDVTDTKDELKDITRTFNAMMDRIEDAYIKQQQFVSDASHELRTPISVIQGYANMLDRWGKDDKAILNESIEAIKNETKNMQELVQKLLFIARNDKKTLVLQKETFNIMELVNELIKQTQMIAQKHRVIGNIHGNVKITADKAQIKQALRIFLDNAVKYTPEGKDIFVSVTLEEGNCAILIKDTGEGISSEDLPKIFDRFYRSDRARNKETGGHGLGLAIARIIILSHNGKIKVRSKQGEGTEFKLLLPLN